MSNTATLAVKSVRFHTYIIYIIYIAPCRKHCSNSPQGFCKLVTTNKYAVAYNCQNNCKFAISAQENLAHNVIVRRCVIHKVLFRAGCDVLQQGAQV